MSTFNITIIIQRIIQTQPGLFYSYTPYYKRGSNLFSQMSL